MTDTIAALRGAAEIGPYFAVDVDAPHGPQWIDYADLVGDPVVLRERVAAVRSVLAQRSGLGEDAIEERVVASLHCLAVAARLVAPIFAAAVATSTVPALTIDAIRWQRTDGGPIPMAFDRPAGVDAPGVDQLAATLHDAVIVTVVAPLVQAFRDTYRLSPKVLWGNIASAVGGAATMLGAARPGFADRALTVAARLVGHGVLAGHARYVEAEPRPYLVRTNCCLFYRIPGGGTCADCVLVSDDDRRRARAASTP